MQCSSRRSFLPPDGRQERILRTENDSIVQDHTVRVCTRCRRDDGLGTHLAISLPAGALLAWRQFFRLAIPLKVNYGVLPSLYWWPPRHRGYSLNTYLSCQGSRVLAPQLVVM